MANTVELVTVTISTGSHKYRNPYAKCFLISKFFFRARRFSHYLKNIYPEKTIIQKDPCTPIFTASLFITARTWKHPRCPLTEEWMKKMWYI